MPADTALLFYDWLHVNHGDMEISLDPSRLSDDGRALATADQQRTEGVFPNLDNQWMIRSKMPHGVRITVEPGRQGDLWLQPDQPWEDQLAWVTVIQEQDRYRCWYHAFPPRSPGGRSSRNHLLCYAESQDGLSWTKPRLNVYDWEGSQANNITCPYGYEAAVFRDDHGPADQRYKTFDREIGSAPASTDDPKLERGLYLCVSPDGYRWTRLPQRAVDDFCDTQNTAWWDPQAGRYVAYLRGRLAGRAISRSETDDPACWPTPTVIFHPSGQDAATVDYYTPGFTPYPGQPGVRLFFVTVYRHDTDMLQTRLAISHNGHAIHWVSHEPIVDSNDRGQSPYLGPNLVRLPNGDLAMPYRLSTKPHNAGHARFYQADPSDSSRFGFGWITWPDARLAGIEADEVGEFVTNPLTCQGGELQINARTLATGRVEVELLEVVTGRHSRPIRGYGLSDCLPLRGDLMWQPVRWREHADLTALKGKQIEIRYRLTHGKIFACRQTVG